ncbi:MAG: (2Fe-2S)-binding protein [Mesorhizobium sp.]|nr:(2Fe-2S)-binding protein [Mesorhizobium sp.]
MSGGSFLWKDVTVPFRAGESVATALMRAGIRDLGRSGAGAGMRYFCGIGACQSCLVSLGGSVVEACLTPACDGLKVEAVEVTHG